MLILSFATIVGYGYALGGLGSYAVGVPKPWPIALGLSGGTLSALAALRIWKTYLEDIEREKQSEDAEDNGER